jgi:hypothetical protein
MKINKLTIICIGLIGTLFLATQTMATPTHICKAAVTIIVDSDYMNKNIVVTVENPISHVIETVGLHRAGGPLVTQQQVDCIVDPSGLSIPLQVKAILTNDALLSTTQIYWTKGKFIFAPEELTAISFPEMFVR